MMQKLKDFLFPCESKIRALTAERDVALRQNQIAHKKLKAVCEGGRYCAFNDTVIPRATFDERHLNVHPRHT